MSGDFLNFGTSAIEMAGTLGIVDQERRMLQHATGYTCEHCGMKHKNRMSLMRHHKTMHQQKHHKQEAPHRTGHTSRGNDYDFDFRI